MAIVLLLLKYYSEITHGDRPQNYQSNDVLDIAVDPEFGCKYNRLKRV